jgi:RimJ/RimL family protein N-acetyltransferase
VPGDAEALASLVADNLEHLSPWLEWATPQSASVDSQRERLAAPTGWDGAQEYNYVIATADGSLIGAIGLMRRIGDGGLEIGYWLSRHATGHGRLTAVTAALSSAALQVDGVQRVEIHCDPTNIRSRRVPERLGYRLDRLQEVPVMGTSGTGVDEIWVLT